MTMCSVAVECVRAGPYPAAYFMCTVCAEIGNLATAHIYMYISV